MKHPLSILASVVACATALACSCDTMPGVAGEIARSDTVFAGRVMKMAIERRVAEPGLPRETEVLVCTFVVVARIKGIAEQKEVVLVTSTQGSACGFPFEIGSKYLVYASVFRGELETSICRRTRQLDIIGQKEAEEAQQVVGRK
jgi:predicted small secreted protein